MHPADFIAFAITLVVETGAMAILAWFGFALLPGAAPSRARFALGAAGIALALNALSHPFFLFWFPFFREATGLEFTIAVLAAEGLIVLGEACVYFAAAFSATGARGVLFRNFAAALGVSLFLNLFSYLAGMAIFAWRN